MAKHHLTMKYMKEFKCIGSACEMNCCAGWRVTMTPEEADQLKASIEAHPSINKTFDETVMKLQDQHIMNINKTGACTLQCNKGLCTLHAAAGESSLPYVCATYPRMVQRVGDRMELTAKTSCPELARKLLFTPNATARVPCNRNLFPRYKPTKSIDHPQAHPWSMYLDDLRNLAIEFLQMEFPVEHRLYLLTEVARRVSPVLNKATQKDPGKRLEYALGPLLDKNNLIISSAHLTQLNWTAETVFSIAVNMVTIRAATSSRNGGDEMRKMFSDICNADDLDLSNIEGASAKLWPFHHKRSEALKAQYSEQLDLFHTRFAEHYWFHELFPAHDNLNAYMTRLLLLLAAQRILLVNDPTLAALLDAGETVPEDLFHATMVKVLSNVSRNMEHHGLINDVIVALSPKAAFPMVQKLCFV